MDLHDKTILITGATGGIGKAIAKKLAAEGCHLILVAQKPTLLKSLANHLCKTDQQQITYYPCNLKSHSDRQKLLRRLKKRYTKIDVLINCAGIGIYKPFGKVTLKDWTDSFELNVTAPYFLAQALTPLMTLSELAIVLNIGSGAGVIPMAERSVYCGTKFALRGSTLSLAKEMAGKPPHFCLLTLGSTLTSFGPLTLQEKKQAQAQGKTYLTPEFVADKVKEIITDQNRQTEYTFYPPNYD